MRLLLGSYSLGQYCPPMAALEASVSRIKGWSGSVWASSEAEVKATFRCSKTWWVSGGQWIFAGLWRMAVMGDVILKSWNKSSVEVGKPQFLNASNTPGLCLLQTPSEDPSIALLLKGWTPKIQWTTDQRHISPSLHTTCAGVILWETVRYGDHVLLDHWSRLISSRYATTLIEDVSSSKGGLPRIPHSNMN